MCGVVVRKNRTESYDRIILPLVMSGKALLVRTGEGQENIVTAVVHLDLAAAFYSMTMKYY